MESVWVLCVCVSTIYTYNRVSVYLNDCNGHLLFLLANEYPASDMLCFFFKYHWWEFDGRKSLECRQHSRPNGFLKDWPETIAISISWMFQCAIHHYRLATQTNTHTHTQSWCIHRKSSEKVIEKKAIGTWQKRRHNKINCNYIIYTNDSYIWFSLEKIIRDHCGAAFTKRSWAGFCNSKSVIKTNNAAHPCKFDAFHVFDFICE